MIYVRFFHFFQGLSSIVYESYLNKNLNPHQRIVTCMKRCVFYIQFDFYEGKMFWVHISTCFETFDAYDQKNKLHF
jgi:hypothetical protein